MSLLALPNLRICAVVFGFSKQIWSKDWHKFFVQKFSGNTNMLLLKFEIHMMKLIVKICLKPVTFSLSEIVQVILHFLFVGNLWNSTTIKMLHRMKHSYIWGDSQSRFTYYRSKFWVIPFTYHFSSRVTSRILVSQFVEPVPACWYL